MVCRDSMSSENDLFNPDSSGCVRFPHDHGFVHGGGEEGERLCVRVFVRWLPLDTVHPVFVTL